MSHSSHLLALSVQVGISYRYRYGPNGQTNLHTRVFLRVQPVHNVLSCGCLLNTRYVHIRNRLQWSVISKGSRVYSPRVVASRGNESSRAGGPPDRGRACGRGPRLR